jgi:hypothetical protein
MLQRLILCLLSIMIILPKYVLATDRIVKYTIGYDLVSRCAPISVSFRGSSSGITSFYKPEAIWGMDLSSQITEMKLANPRQSFHINSLPEIIYQPDEEINLTYKLCAYKDSNDSYNRPHISDQLSYF